MEPPPNPSTCFPVAALELAEVEGECEALRGTVESQRHTIEALEEELEEERNAASTAANEAMSMILRLQREKAQALLESRQFHRLAEERFQHDQQEIESLVEELSRREDLVHALSRQIQDRPAAKSDRSEEEEEEEFGVTETMDEVLEKEIVLGESPGGGDGEREVEEEEVGGGFSDGSACESGVRIYTIDEVHGVGGSGEGSGREREPSVVGESDVRDLQRRVKGLEQGSEVMRREIVNMKMEDKHLVMLREISRNLLKVMMVQHTLVQVRMRERQVVKNRSYLSRGFSLPALLKWLVSFLFFWRRRKPSQPELPCRGSSCGSSSNKVGLFLLLEKSPLFQRLRCLPKARGRA